MQSVPSFGIIQFVMLFSSMLHILLTHLVPSNDEQVAIVQESVATAEEAIWRSHMHPFRRVVKIIVA